MSRLMALAGTSPLVIGLTVVDPVGQSVYPPPPNPRRCPAAAGQSGRGRARSAQCAENKKRNSYFAALTIPWMELLSVSRVAHAWATRQALNYLSLPYSTLKAGSQRWRVCYVLRSCEPRLWSGSYDWRRAAVVRRRRGRRDHCGCSGNRAGWTMVLRSSAATVHLTPDCAGDSDAITA